MSIVQTLKQSWYYIPSPFEQNKDIEVLIPSDGKIKFKINFL